MWPAGKSTSIGMVSSGTPMIGTKKLQGFWQGRAASKVLTKVHWKVLRFIREYYFYHGRAPMNRHLKEGTRLSLGEIESLFPGGIRRGARRLAGLPNPKSCF